MKTYTILLSILVCNISVSSQGFINKDKSYVRKWLNKEIVKYDSLDIVLIETDSTIVYDVPEGKTLPLTITYYFKNGRCNAEKVKASCDSCFQQFLSARLNKKKYDWKKINGHQYVSGYKHRLLLEIPPENKDHSFMIIRSSWNREAYKLLTN